MSEIAFEYLAFARETTRGTAITTPTHYVSFGGMLVPDDNTYTPEDRSGTLAGTHRSEQIRNWVAFSGEGGLDVDFMPFLLQMAANGSVSSPTTPAGASLTRLWTFPRQMTSNGLKTATGWFGDPNIAGTEVWRSAFLILDQFSIEGDASGEDGVTWDMSGWGNEEVVVSSPTLPTRMAGAIPIPGAMQLWIDTSSAIGTTEITTTNSLVAASASCLTGQEPKYTARGPGVTTYNRTSIQATTPEGWIRTEVDNFDLYDYYKAQTFLKIRQRYSGALIEDTTGTGGSLFYYYVQVDFPHAKLGKPEMTENIGNRCHQFPIIPHYDTTAGTDAIWYVQNQKATI